MSREILFKAKRIDNGEWVEGYLYRISERLNPFIMIRNGLTASYEVDENTVCQYTGLTDKNGNKIWENDVVYIPYERLEDSYCKVIFRRGGFIGEMADGCEDCLLNRKTEVIGNIFDNPELIGGATNESVASAIRKGGLEYE